MKTFFLGAHMPNWLAQTSVPLFISYHRLKTRKSFPRALGPWALDSGGFTELSTKGAWTIAPKEYVAAVKRYQEEIGNLEWAAAQDWMCEPWILAKTGLTVEEHQRRTIDNFLELKALAPELPFVPVVQGWSLASYWRHVEAYTARGIDLSTLDRVGVGSVCRRQSGTSGSNIISTLAHDGLKIHGFGFKVDGLALCHEALESADSMAWSLDARFAKRRQEPGADPNSLEYALSWRAALLAKLYPEQPKQPPTPERQQQHEESVQLRLW